MLWYAIGVKSNCHAEWAVHGSLVVNGQGDPVDTETETDTDTETETEVLGTSPAACHHLCVAFVPLQLLSILLMSEWCEVTRRRRRHDKKSQGWRAVWTASSRVAVRGVQNADRSSAGTRAAAATSRRTRPTTSTSTGCHRLRLGRRRARVPQSPGPCSPKTRPVLVTTWL